MEGPRWISQEGAKKVLRPQEHLPVAFFPALPPPSSRLGGDWDGSCFTPEELKGVVSPAWFSLCLRSLPVSAKIGLHPDLGTKIPPLISRIWEEGLSSGGQWKLPG